MLASSTPLLIASAAALCVFLTFALLAASVSALVQPTVTKNQRLTKLGLREGKADTTARQNLNPRQKRIQDRVQSLENRKRKQGPIAKIRSKMLQAGLQGNLRNYFLASILVGVLTMSGAYLSAMPLFVVVSSGFIAGYYLPQLYLSALYKRRQKLFTSEFANALDVIIRGVRSGLPVGECLNIIGRELPDPVGEEFRHLVEGQKIGLTLQELLQRGLQRMPTKEYKFFAIVLQIQQETGGNLADTLDNLANVLRERKRMRDKANALASEAKSSAAIIGALPFLVMAGMGTFNPEYIGPLFTTTAGNIVIGVGLGWMAIGIVVMRQMINFKM